MAIFINNDKHISPRRFLSRVIIIFTRKASFDGGSYYRNRQANVCYDVQVREHCYEHAVRG